MYFDVIPVEIHQLVIILANLSNRRVDVCIVGRLDGKNFWLTRLRYTVPTHANWLTGIQKRCVILILVHHWMETEDCCEIITRYFSQLTFNPKSDARTISIVYFFRQVLKVQNRVVTFILHLLFLFIYVINYLIVLIFGIVTFLNFNLTFEILKNLTVLN